MGLYLVPTDQGHLADVGLKDQVLANIREKLEIAINDMANDPRIVDKPDDVKVIDMGNAIHVEVRGGKDVALEQGVHPHQMLKHEGSVVPIKTKSGEVIYRKVTRLSILKGKFVNPGRQGRQRVKERVSNVLGRSAESVVEAKETLEGHRLPRLRDVLGVR